METIEIISEEKIDNKFNYNKSNEQEYFNVIDKIIIKEEKVLLMIE